jgi:hypothetical protein
MEGKGAEVPASQGLDERSNSNDLSRNDAVVLYNISTTAFFRFVRFRMVGQTTDSSWYFFLQPMEVFGILTGETTSSLIPHTFH